MQTAMTLFHGEGFQLHGLQAAEDSEEEAEARPAVPVPEEAEARPPMPVAGSSSHSLL